MYDFLVKRSPWTDFDPAIDTVFVNIGVPTGYFTDHACERIFHEALCLAYLLATDSASLSAGDGSINLPAWEDACERAMLKIDSVRNQLCYTYPEVAAGVQCVMRSSTAMDGLYVTLDVGAGTLDMNAFLRHTAQGWQHVDVRPKDLNYYAAKVSDHGIARLGNQLNRHPFCEYPHLTKCISSDSGYKLISRTDLFNEIRQEVGTLKYEALTRQPNHGHQGQKRTWDSCRVYGWGGGMYHEAYQSCLRNALADWIHDVEIIHLPSPQQLELPRGADFNRLAIAYGLSFPKVNLEKIKLPEETPPMGVTPRKAYLPETPDDPGFSTMDRYED